MVKFIKNLWLYWQFKRAIKLCRKLNDNRKPGEPLNIVANICGKPYIVNRPSFRKLRTKGIFKSSLQWQDVFNKRITEQTLQQWTS